jgi:hypothetical protein
VSSDTASDPDSSGPADETSPAPSQRPKASLPGGRSTAPLTEDKQKSVARTIVGLDPEVPYKHLESGYTHLAMELDEDQLEVGVVYFAADIYPGQGAADPNSVLSMKAAVAHELSHFHRWRDQRELPLGVYRDLDEAMTSLDAALRYARHLSTHEIEQLISDALQRLTSHFHQLPSGGQASE